MIKTFFSLSGIEFLLRFSRFIFFLYLANNLGAETLGIYSYLISIYSIIIVLTELGILKQITKLKSLNFDEKYLNFISNLRILFFLIVAIIATVFLEAPNYLNWLVLLLVFSDVLFENVYAFYRGEKQFSKEVFIKFIISIIYIVYILFIYIFEYKNIFNIFLGLSTIFIIYSIFIYRKNICVARVKLEKVFQLIKVAIPIYIGAVLTVVYFKIDILMIENILSTEYTAYYSVASKILELILVIPAVIGNILLPYFTTNNTKVEKNLVTQFIIALLVFLIFYFCGKYIVQIFFSSEFNFSSEIFSILVFSVIPIVINSYFFTYFISKDLSIYYMYITFVMALSNFLLNIIYIPKYGVNAAAYTTVCTEYIGTIIILYLYVKNIKRNREN